MAQILESAQTGIGDLRQIFEEMPDMPPTIPEFARICRSFRRSGAQSTYKPSPYRVTDKNVADGFIGRIRESTGTVVKPPRFKGKLLEMCPEDRKRFPVVNCRLCGTHIRKHDTVKGLCPPCWSFQLPIQ